MSETWQIPALGDGVSEGVVARLVVSAGTRVAEGDPLLEIETDKVVMEVPAPADGVVEAWLVAEGDTLTEGTAYARIAAGTGGSAPVSVAPEASDPAPEPVADPEPAPKPASAPEPERAVAPASELTPPAPEVPPAPATDPAGAPDGEAAPAGPAARRLARELGVDIAEVSGSGRRGRISKQDVKRHVRERQQAEATGASVAGSAPAGSAAALPDLAAFGAVSVQPLDGLGRAVAANMQRAWREVPHAWVTREVVIDALAAARARLRARHPDVPLTMTALLAAALARVLREFPAINAAYDARAQARILRENVHLGVAVDTPRGLVVPVLRDADRLGLAELATRLAELADAARAGRLSPADLRGGSITLSNLGGLGATSLLPMVNWPEVAILGVGASEQRLRLVDGEVVTETRLPLTLGFDHRVINGADAARLLARLAERLEEPLALAL
ncbi:MAG: 2-oxo acid dehydrogenase subunit E2 [Gammaproteobacteria bacterium]|nr:MAG: 2-oxo acid dehydrogenase subunit E2 [Gammaproteobacteria bacterium]